MSADNWARCPRCVLRAQAELASYETRIVTTYGKVSLALHDGLRASAQELKDKLEDEWGEFRTFREDYRFYGAEEGEVTASYSGSCKVCGLRLSFKDVHPILEVDE